MTNHENLILRLLHKKNNRHCIGWTDFSRGSWDWRMAEAQAYRIVQRSKGIRVSWPQAMAMFR
jgi:hypothetical protein